MPTICLSDRWDDVVGDRYIEMEINRGEYVCVKVCGSGLKYVMKGTNGCEIYGRDKEDVRNMTTFERQDVMDFVDDQIQIEDELNMSYEEV